MKIKGLNLRALFDEHLALKTKNTMKKPSTRTSRKIKTVKASELSTMKMSCGNAKKYPVIVDNGQRKRWVGIGWVDEGPATSADEDKYPRVIG